MLFNQQGDWLGLSGGLGCRNLLNFQAPWQVLLNLKIFYTCCNRQDMYKSDGCV
jgi:hypothetical protein